MKYLLFSFAMFTVINVILTVKSIINITLVYKIKRIRGRNRKRADKSCVKIM